MPCTDEIEKQEDAWNDLLSSDAELKKAERKLENRLKVALATCGVGAVSSLTGLVGLLAGGSACIAALLAADDAAADYENAVTQNELADSKHFRALKSEFLCLGRCGPTDAPANS